MATSSSTLDVVDAPPADPAEEVEGPFVRLEHHLLARAGRSEPAACGCRRAACALPSPWSSHPTGARTRGSSRTGRPRRDRSSAAQNPATATTPATADARSWRSGAPRRSRRPLMRTNTSSRCHRQFDQLRRATRRRLVSPANSGPKRFHQNLTVSWQTSMPRSTSRSSTCLSDNG